MDWKDYEETIYYYLTWLYPEVQILYNQKIIGSLSGSNHQVDILVDKTIAGNPTRIIIDSESYKDVKIDTKDVESFVDLLKDCKAQYGLLTTTKGFTESAIKIAYSHSDIDVDILDYETIKQSDGIGVIIQNGNCSALITAPFGWVIDKERNHPDFLAAIYQRDLNIKSAYEKREWIYVNIILKSETINSFDDFLLDQANHIKMEFPDSKIEYDTRNFDKVNKIIFREITNENKSHRAITGFIDFDDFIFYAALITPSEFFNKNIRKLEYIIDRTLPGGIM